MYNFIAEPFFSKKSILNKKYKICRELYKTSLIIINHIKT